MFYLCSRITAFGITHGSRLANLSDRNQTAPAIALNVNDRRPLARIRGDPNGRDVSGD